MGGASEKRTRQTRSRQVHFLLGAKFDFAIVGGGSLGLGVAAVAAAADCAPYYSDERDSVRPRADTLRNQALLQSGMSLKVEDDRHRIVLARRMNAAGRAMLFMRLNFQSQAMVKGLVRVSTSDEVDGCSGERPNSTYLMEA